MESMPIVWKVGKLLKTHNITAYRLRQESGLSVGVAYGIANGEHQALDLGVIEKLIPALRKLTGNPKLQIGDVVEYRNE
jgi:DNA-binding Xre family transcriptional regulator